jgi:hypothetical protein
MNLIWIKSSVVTAAIVGAVSLAGTASAKTIPEVQKFLLEELTRMEAAPPLTPESERLGSLSDYQLSLFRLRIKAEFGFDVGVGKISLEPVAEFFWE